MNVIMPQLGETVAEGKIASWFKQVGDRVERGDNLFLIETDKVSMEVQATEAGTLNEIRVPAGETVPVGTVVAVVGKPGEKAAPTPAPVAPKPASRPAPAPASRQVAAPIAAAPRSGPFKLDPFDEVHTPTGPRAPQLAPSVSLEGLKVTPLARRLIKDQNADLGAIVASVRARGGWRIAASDVTAAPAASARAAPRAPVALGATDRIEPLNRIRAATAAHLAEAWKTIPHVFQAVEADFTAVAAARGKAKDGFAQRHGFALTYLPFVARAVCIALGEFPKCNASFDRDRLIMHGEVHLGIATDLNNEGLVVPVIHNAGAMTVAGIARAIARLAEAARAGRLLPGDLMGGTYTITNNGSFGTSFTAPVINAPQSAILSFDAVRKKPAVIEGEKGDSIAVRPIGMLGQSFDHRAFDGAYSAAFLQRLKRAVETHDWAAELE